MVCDQHEGGEEGEEHEGEDEGEDEDEEEEDGEDEAGDCGRETLYAYSLSAPYPDLTRGQVEYGGCGGGARYLTVVQAGVVPGKEGVDEVGVDGVEGEEEVVEEEEGEVGQEESVDV